MDKNGNLTEEEKTQLANLLNKFRTWWLGGIQTKDLVDSIETFRKFIEEDE